MGGQSNFLGNFRSNLFCPVLPSIRPSLLKEPALLSTAKPKLRFAAHILDGTSGFDLYCGIGLWHPGLKFACEGAVEEGLFELGEGVELALVDSLKAAGLSGEGVEVVDDGFLGFVWRGWNRNPVQ